MKKYLFTILALAFLLIIPSNIMAIANTSYELTQADLTAAEQSVGITTDKGITYVSENGVNKYYLSDGTYSLAEDLTISDKLFMINEGRTVTINFNGKALNVNNSNNVLLPAIVNEGTLTIINSKVVCTNSESFCEDLVGIGTTTIESGTFKYVVLNGTATINGGTFKGTDNSSPLFIGGNTTINRGTFEANGASSVYFYDVDDDYNPQNKYTLTINGGTFTSIHDNGLEIMGGKKITINNGTFKGGVSGITLLNDVDMELKGGKFTATSEDEDIVRGGITVYVKNIDLTKYVASGYEYTPTLTISSKDFTDTDGVVYSQKEISVQEKESVYEILDGANQTYEDGKDLVIKASGNLNKLTNVLMDNNEIPENGRILTNGSTILTLKSDYLKTLTVGEHTVSFVYTNGKVDTKIIIPEPKAIPTNGEKNPKTSDNMIIYLVTLIVSIIGLNIVLKNRLFN